ncbi:pentapeptide repeat-containing protein [Lentzea sp. JNUCC 0626]|uniref:pentapeptide repeat-containing protein n=1 Tax=Lentzea sp. JNUCC 0626 TaxID=3367513 RepID=UPI003747DB59
MRALTPRAIVFGAIVLLGAGVIAAALLLVNFSGTAPAERLDAIRTAATLMVGTGGAAALLLAARRQRSAELTLAVQQKAAVDTKYDAAERRLTELYIKAVEQLGSDKAAVRLGGLYALERLADGNVEHRQTVINLICAYLRMPYNPPDSVVRRMNAPSEADPTLAKSLVGEGEKEGFQEGEVRIAAQRILADHLRPELRRDGAAAGPSGPSYWDGDLYLDLQDAILVNFNMDYCRINTAWFDGARFYGDTQFQFTVFVREVSFREAVFDGGAWFNRSSFDWQSDFDESKFISDAWFQGVVFERRAAFHDVTFGGNAMMQAEYRDGVSFSGSKFGGDTWFNRVVLKELVSFAAVHFMGVVNFEEAECAGGLDPDFTGALLSGSVDGVCTWPEGWTTRSFLDEEDGLEGLWRRLVRIKLPAAPSNEQHPGERGEREEGQEPHVPHVF